MWIKRILRCCSFILIGLFSLSAHGQNCIGIYGGNYEKYLSLFGMKCQTVNENDFETQDGLSRYSAIIFLGGHDYNRAKALREYVNNGGVLYTQYPQRSISGTSWTGYSAGQFFAVKSEKEHLLTRGLTPGVWIELKHPLEIPAVQFAASHIITPEKDGCEELLSVRLSQLKKEEKNGVQSYQETGKPVAGTWMSAYPYGKGLVVTGLSGLIRYGGNVNGYSKEEDPVIKTLLTNLGSFLNNNCHKSITETNIISAKLFMEINDANDPAVYPKEIYINGELAGLIPGWTQGWSAPKEIPVSDAALKKLATTNTVLIKNTERDPFKIRNIYLEVTTKEGQKIKSNVNQDVLCSTKFSWSGVEGKTSEYNGMPLPVFSLILPIATLGFVSQPDFKYEIPEIKSKLAVEWKNIEQASISKNTKGRTSCWMVYSDFVRLSKEEILKKLESYNAGDFASIVSTENIMKNDELLQKIKWLREKGYRFTCALHKIPSDGWLPGSEKYNKFFEAVKFCSKISDCVMVDEWYFSPALLQTEGSGSTVIKDEFKNAFKLYSNLNEEDIKWAFKNPYSDDQRSVKLWDFCSKTGNDFMREVVKTAKTANPQIKTSISYISHDWNKLVSALDSCISEFDEILNCQTYWYGRHSFDPLDAAKITNAIGVGKLFQSEYPDKFSWLGFGPAFTGSRPLKTEGNKFWKHYSNYGNTAEEIVPYLATLYASGSGVFVFVVFDGYASGDGSDDDYADVVRLVSQLVPHVKDYVKSDVAYYYNPETTWEMVRTKTAAADFARREGDIVSLGYVQQFLDADVVKDPKGYKNVIASGCHFPSSLDYKNQNAYFMYKPEFEINGKKISAAPLEKIGIKGTGMIKAGYYKISGDVAIDKAMLYSAFAIQNPFKSLRTAADLDEKGKEYCIGAENADGNVRINSLCPFYTSQSVMKPMMKDDFKKFGWAKRDCPQINGKSQMVAVAFREPRTAVLDFGNDVSYANVKIVVFNGKDGIVRNETVKYSKGMKIDLPPLNVLVAQGIK